MFKAIFAIALLFGTLEAEQSAICAGQRGGRLGDHLIHVASGIWVADKFDLPLVLVPFTNSDLFAFHYQFPTLENSPFFGNEKRVLKQICQIDPSVEGILYVPIFKTPYGSNVEPPNVTRKTLNGVDWEDPKFRQLLAHHFQPINPVPTVQTPEGYHTVAVHIRTWGDGGFDRMWAPKKYPSKFTSLPWAVKKVKEIHQLLDFKPLYVHLFTDSPDPSALLAKIKKKLKHPNMIVKTESDNRSTESLFRDLFSMMQFDYLICPHSSFSFIAWLLGNHKLTFRQGKTEFVDGKFIVESEYRIEAAANH